jgi:hypothetical protein
MSKRREILLRQVHTDLINLTHRSSLIEIEPIDWKPPWAPEKYIVTFRCKGIARIDEFQHPVFSREHRVEIYFSQRYPANQPDLLWLTAIWHPNIDHTEPRHVCTDESMTWYTRRSIDDFVVMLAEMVQYKRYHAKNVPPFPQDKEVAQWVVDVAEPNGWVSHDKPIDVTPLERESKIRKSTGPKTSAPPPRVESKIRFGPARLPTTPSRIIFGKPRDPQQNS